MEKIRRMATRVRMLRAAVVLAAIALVMSTGPTVASAMSNGVPVQAGSAPWFVSITFTEGSRVVGQMVTGSRLDRLHCGGVLIDPVTVLTAAHCVVDPEAVATSPRRALAPSVFGVTLGDAPAGESSAVERTVRHIDIAPGFGLVANPRDPANLDIAAAHDDVALMTLAAPVPRARTLAVSAAPAVAGTSVTLLGHGYTPAGSRSDQLLRGSLSVISAAACARQTFVEPVRAGMICAQSRPGVPSVQAGYGDSGGPMVIGGGAQARLLGIFSFGTETVADLFTPGFNAASDVRVAALRWPALRVHLHL